jgi:6-pyruvoyltetrahydropterin/6-carboxytetrahydropterin synthase
MFFAMQTLTKRIGFTASHYYWSGALSDEENHQVFRACANRHGHGHNYRVEVSLTGPVAEKTGMMMNFLDLEEILQRKIVLPLDHKNLNAEVPFFETHVPTLENIALYLWENLAPEVEQSRMTLKQIRVVENDDLTYDGALSPC